MTRSRKKHSIITVSKKVSKYAHRAVRKFVKQKLRTMDPYDPPVLDIEGDTRTLGHEEWGTKFGYDFMGSLSEEERAEYDDDYKKSLRK